MKQPIFVFLITLVLFSFPVVFFNGYLLQKAGDLESKIAYKKLLLEHMKNMEKDLARLPKDWPGRAGFWLEPDYGIQQQIQMILQDHDATIQNVNITGVTTLQSHVDRLTINAAFLITEEKWWPLLAAIEKHKPYLLIATLSMHPQDKNGMLYANAAIIAFRYKESP